MIKRAMSKRRSWKLSIKCPCSLNKKVTFSRLGNNSRRTFKPARAWKTSCKESASLKRFKNPELSRTIIRYAIKNAKESATRIVQSPFRRIILRSMKDVSSLKMVHALNVAALYEITLMLDLNISP